MLFPKTPLIPELKYSMWCRRGVYTKSENHVEILNFSCSTFVSTLHDKRCSWCLLLQNYPCMQVAPVILYCVIKEEQRQKAHNLYRTPAHEPPHLSIPFVRTNGSTHVHTYSTTGKISVFSPYVCINISMCAKLIYNTHKPLKHEILKWGYFCSVL